MYGCAEGKIHDEEYILAILNELPDILGMHKISEPAVLNYPGKEDSFDKGGVSAFVIIAESHISVHTFKQQKFASLDMFSCKEFDVDRAVDYIKAKFRPKKIEKNLTMRGREFPKDVEKVKVIMKKERPKTETHIQE